MKSGPLGKLQVDEFPDFAVTDMVLGGVGVPNHPLPPAQGEIDRQPSRKTNAPRPRKTTKTMLKVTSSSNPAQVTCTKGVEDSHGDAQSDKYSETEPAA